jgi:N-acetylmuramoyl-L-alanine amidase
MILKLGSKGEKVKELQTLLQKHGFWSHPTITDNFGPITEKSVVAFQKSKNLKDDGKVGPKTWDVLTSILPTTLTPIYPTTPLNEDKSDPEDEIKVETLKEAQPTCPNISELIHLINSSNIHRKVTRLIFHCTATHQSATVEGILKYWKNNLGWKNPGYHIIVNAAGHWTQLLDFNGVSNGVAGANSTSINVAYIGGIDSKGRASDNRTQGQSEVFEVIYNTFRNKLPNLTFHGHYEFSKKECPSYNVREWIKSLDKI